MKRICVLVCLVILSLAIFCGNSFAQATASASLEGTITDQSQAMVANAQVTLTSKDTGAVRATQSNSAGSYRFDLLSAGHYDLKVTMQGFKLLLPLRWS